MSNIFCQQCNNLLVTISTTDELYFKCDQCQIKYNSDETNSMRYEEVKGSNLTLYSTLMRYAHKDPVNPKVYRQCPSCAEPIVRQIRLGENMTLINCCPQCAHSWLES